MTAWADMKHDLLPLGPMTWWQKVSAWARFYWWPTKRWLPKVEAWWLYNVRRYPKPPPLDLDPVYQRLFGADVSRDDASRDPEAPSSGHVGPVSDVGRGVAKDVPADGSRVSSVQGDA